MVISIPKRAIVCVFGPSCSGKSTLAERIIAESPYHSKGVHSGDKALAEIYRAYPELALHSLISMGLVPSPVNPSPAMQRIQQNINNLMTDKLESILEQCDLVVIDEIRMKPDIILPNLHILHDIAGNREIILIKMAPTEKVYRLFYEKRLGDRRLTKEIVDDQRRRFTAVAECDFARACEFLTEYNVSDPREISLKFT